MEEKRALKPKSVINGVFEIKAHDTEVKGKKPRKIKIAGFANKANRDRIKDLILPEAWNLENFLKNPVILVNHGQDPEFGKLPVGKATKIEVKDDGLFIEAEVLEVEKHAPTMKLISLIENGIVRAFSVGFMPLEEKENEDGGKNITKAELYEVSIVGVPMQQDSIFEVTGKMLKSKSIEQIAQDVTFASQAVEYANDYIKSGVVEEEAVQKAINDLMKEYPEVSFSNDFYKTIVKAFSLDDDTKKKEEDTMEGEGREIPAAKDDKENNEDVTPQLELLKEMKEIQKSQLIILESIATLLKELSAEQEPQQEEQSSEDEQQASEDEQPQEMTRALVPTEDMTREELRAALQERANKFGIEITDDAKLTFPSGFPKDLSLYGDPVNLKFPLDTKERAQNARVRFKQVADDIYEERNSKKIVHNRIVKAELKHGIKPSYNPDDPLDKLLEDDVVEQIVALQDEEKSIQALDELQKNIENLTKRLNNLI